jgi:hypothetical protein
MSKPAIPMVANDFAAVIAFFQSKGIVPANPSQNLLVNAKSIHGFTFSLIIWRFRLKSLPTHASVFIEEIASDALQLLPQILMGYSKTAKILTRGIIENTLRHIYFSDHPVEFARMNGSRKWFLTIEDLFDYAKQHPSFTDTEQQFGALADLKSLHSDLSAGIHGRAVTDLEMRVALSKISYDDVAARREVESLRKTSEATNFLLAIFHKAQVAKFQREDQSTILRSMPPRAREIWRHYEC